MPLKFITAKEFCESFDRKREANEMIIKLNKKDSPNSDIHLAGSKKIKPAGGKSVKLAGATKVIGKGRKK